MDRVRVEWKDGLEICSGWIQAYVNEGEYVIVLADDNELVRVYRCDLKVVRRG